MLDQSGRSVVCGNTIVSFVGNFLSLAAVFGLHGQLKKKKKKYKEIVKCVETRAHTQLGCRSSSPDAFLGEKPLGGFSGLYSFQSKAELPRFQSFYIRSILAYFAQRDCEDACTSFLEEFKCLIGLVQYNHLTSAALLSVSSRIAITWAVQTGLPPSSKLMAGLASCVLKMSVLSVGCLSLEAAKAVIWRCLDPMTCTRDTSACRHALRSSRHARK